VKVEIFSATSSCELQRKMEYWLNTHENIDIKHVRQSESLAYDGQRRDFSLTSSVWYTLRQGR